MRNIHDWAPLVEGYGTDRTHEENDDGQADREAVEHDEGREVKWLDGIRYFVSRTKLQGNRYQVRAKE